MNRRHLLSIAAGAAAAGAGPPLAARAQQTLTPLIVGALRSSDMANLYYGVQQNEFKQAGLDVTIQQMPSGAAALAAVAGGSMNIAVSNVLSLAQASQRGIPVRVIASSGSYSPENAGGNQLLVAAGSAVNTPRDLEGKTIAVTSLHDLMTVAISSWLDAKGVDRSKVSYIELPPNAMLAALQAGRVAAMAIYDPFLSAAKAQGARVLGQPYDGIAPRFTITAWFAIDPWATQNRDVALRFASVLNRLAPYANSHYADLVPMIAAYTKLPEETLRHMSHPIVLPLKNAPMQPTLDISAKYKEIDTFNAAAMTLPGAV